MYRILVTNRTEQTLWMPETTRIASGMGRMVAASNDILVADRLAAVVAVAVVMDFPSAERDQFIVTATEFGWELDHPQHGRISVTIFDSCPSELGEPSTAEHGASAAFGD